MTEEIRLFKGTLQLEIDEQDATGAIDSIKASVDSLLSDLGRFDTQVSDFGDALALSLEAPRQKLGAFTALFREGIRSIRDGSTTGAESVGLISTALSGIAQNIPILSGLSSGFDRLAGIADTTNKVMTRLRGIFGGTRDDLGRVMQLTSDTANAMRQQTRGWQMHHKAVVATIRAELSDLKSEVGVVKKFIASRQEFIDKTKLAQLATNSEIITIERAIAAREQEMQVLIQSGENKDKLVELIKVQIQDESRLNSIRAKGAVIDQTITSATEEMNAALSKRENLLDSLADAQDNVNIVSKVQGPILASISSHASTAANSIRHLATGFDATGKVAVQRLKDAQRSTRLMFQEIQRLKQAGAAVPVELQKTYRELGRLTKFWERQAKKQQKAEAKTAKSVRDKTGAVVKSYDSQTSSVERTTTQIERYNTTVRDSATANRELERYVSPTGIVTTGFSQASEAIAGTSKELSTFNLSMSSIVSIGAVVGGMLGDLDPAFSALIVGASQVADQFMKSFSAMISISGTAAQKIKAAMGIISNSFIAFGTMALGVIVKTGLLGAEVKTLEITLRQVARNVAKEAGGDIQRFEAYVLSVRDAVIKTGITTREATSALTQFVRARLPVDRVQQLADNAKNLGVTVANMSSSEVFGRFIQVIQTGNSALLKAVGITKTAHQMQEDYAKALGLSSKKQLTAAQLRLAIIEGINEQTKTVAGVYEEAQKTAGKQLSSMKRLFEEMMLTLGSRFEPLIAGVVIGFNNFLKWFNALDPEIHDAIASFLKWTAVLGILIGIVLKLGPALKALIPVIRLIGGSIATAMPWVFAIGAAIAAIIIVIKLLKKAWDSNFGSIQDVIKDFVNFFKTQFAPIIENIRGFAERISSIFRDIAEVVGSVVEPILRRFFTNLSIWLLRLEIILEPIFTTLNDAVIGFGTSVAAVLGAISSLLVGDATQAVGLFEKAFVNALTSIALLFKNIIGKAATWGWNLIIQVVNGIVKAANKVLVVALRGIGNLIGRFFKPGSPPKEGPLKHIADWGRGLMNTLFRSFGKADFGILRETTGLIRDALQGAVKAGTLTEKELIPALQSVRKNVSQLLSDLRATGNINEEVLGQISDTLGEGSEEYVKYIRLLAEHQKAMGKLEGVQEEYNAAQEAGFIPRELQARMDAAKEEVEATKDALDWQKEYLAAVKDTTDLQQEQLDLLERLAEKMEDVAKALGGIGGEAGVAPEMELDLGIPDDFGEGIGSVFDDIALKIGGASEEFLEMRKKVQDVIDSIKTWLALPLSEKWTVVKTWLEETGANFLTWLEDVTGIDFETLIADVAALPEKAIGWLEDLTGWDISGWIGGVQEAIIGFWELVVEKAQWLYDELVGESIIPDLIDEIIAQFERLDVFAQVSTFWDTLKERWELLKFIVGETVADWRRRIESFVAKMELIFAPLIAIFTTPFTGLVEIISELFKELSSNEELSEAFAELWEALGQAWEDIQPALEEIWKLLKPVLAAFAIFVASKAVLVISAIAAGMIALKDAIISAIPFVVDIITGIVQFVTSIVRLGSVMGNFIQGVFALFRGDMDTAKEKFGLWKEGLIEAVLGLKTSFLRIFGSIGAGIVTAFLTFFATFGVKLAEFIVGVLEGLGVLDEETAAKIREWIDGIKTKLSTTIGQISLIFQHWIEKAIGIFTGLSEQITIIWGALWDWVVKKVTEIWNALVGQSVITDMITAIELAWTNFVANIELWWATLWENILTKLVDTFVLISDAWDTWKKAIKAAWLVFTSALKLLWTQLWISIKATITNKFTEIKTALITWITELKAKFRGIKTWLTTWVAGFASIGSSIVSNLKAGFLTKWNTWIAGLKEKFAELAALLPFSEPKDPTSPLRDLGKAGKAILSNILEGMDDLDVSAQFGARLAGMTAQTQAAVGATTNNRSTVNNNNFAGAFPNVRDARDGNIIKRQLDNYFSDADIRSRGS